MLCKPSKLSGWPPHELGKTGFGKLRREFLATVDLARFKARRGASADRPPPWTTPRRGMPKALIGPEVAQ